MSGDFHSTVETILSANDYAMKAAAGAWMALAGAATRDQDRLREIAGDTVAEPGVGLAELAERLDRAGGWGAGAASVALAIGRQLQNVGDATAEAAERALSLRSEYRSQEKAQESKAADAVATGSIQADKAMAMHDNRMALLTQEARSVLDGLSRAYAAVNGGTAPSAPEVNPAGGGGPPGMTATGGGDHGAVTVGGGHGTVHDGGGPQLRAANGTTVGAGSYPHSSVVGPDGGDFAGWVRSPSTGFLVDPATGREFDPVTGRWIDPVTGRPFGEVTEYATRLAGLGGGPGGLAGAGGVGLAAVGGGASALNGITGLYGGNVPPSIAQAGPAQQQAMRQAARNLSHRADVANRFAMREAAQGGRPYQPPPGAASHGTSRAAGGTGAARPRTTGGSARPWRPPAADAAARHRLTGSGGGARPVPPPAPGGTRAQPAPERKRGPGRSTDLTEDPSVWSGGRRATGGVLGE